MQNILSKVCAPAHDPRTNLHTPWHCTQGTGASNGAILLVQKVFEPAPQAVNQVEVLVSRIHCSIQHTYESHWLDLTEIDTTPIAFQSNGITEQVVQIHDQMFQAKYLNLIKQLPRSKIAVSHSNPQGAALIAFDQGFGALMPCIH